MTKKNSIERQQTSHKGNGSGRDQLSSGPVSTDPAVEAAVVHSALERTHHAVIAYGKMGVLFAQYLQHAKTVGPLPAEQGLTLMRDSLAAAALQLALLPPDQYCSWTLNLVQPPLNVFLAGDNHEFQLTGRVFEQDVKTAATNRLFVEVQRPRHEPARSVVDFSTNNALEAFTNYFGRALQMQARLFVLDEDELVLIQGLPHVHRPWLAGLERDDVRRLLEEGIEPIEERAYRFLCGCNEEKMIAAIRDIYGSNLQELFQDQASVEVRCPRCGRHWNLSRAKLSFGV